MNENQAMYVSAVIATTFLAFLMAFGFVSLLAEQNNVIEISEEAVFVVGHACVVNVGERDTQDVLDDLDSCASIIQGNNK